jgi:membrane associated rhomboid family serine protease
MWQMNRDGGRAPSWLKRLERHLQWLAIPNIAILLVTLQGLGFLLLLSDPIWRVRLALLPEAVKAGEVWRLITFLSEPLSDSPIWVIFVLWFLYFVVNTIEEQWGAFKTTLYTLISILMMITFSLTFNYPVANIQHFESSLFLAAAALFPEMEVMLFMVIPVKVKWLAWFTGALVAWEFLRGGMLDRLFLIAIYSNYLIFFGPAIYERIRLWARRRKYRRGLRD